MGKDRKIPVEWGRVTYIYLGTAVFYCYCHVIIVYLLVNNYFSVELCAEDTAAQENEEELKPKDQEDCKIRSKAPNKKRKRSNMEKSLDVFCEKFTQISKEETER